MKMLPVWKTIEQYHAVFSEYPKEGFNIFLARKYGSYENLLLACIKAGKEIEELEPILSKYEIV